MHTDAAQVTDDRTYAHSQAGPEALDIKTLQHMILFSRFEAYFPCRVGYHGRLLVATDPDQAFLANLDRILPGLLIVAVVSAQSCTCSGCSSLCLCQAACSTRLVNAV